MATKSHSNKKNVYIGLSGGVDSAISAYLLQQEGYYVKGVFANCFYTPEQCRSSQDLADAISVASKLGIELEVKDYREDYREGVLNSFYREYDKGRTPNPDILCNSVVKFGAMADDVLATTHGYCLATGHYVATVALALGGGFTHGGINEEVAKVIDSNIGSSSGANLLLLATPKDTDKDQSYFLYQVYRTPELLPKLIFPLSGYLKTEVRDMAYNVIPSISGKPDSQGICFVGDVKLREFIKKHVKAKPGLVVNLDGEVVGSHPGVQFFTIGQRHGFDLKVYSSKPLYIVEKVYSENKLVVGPRETAYSPSFKISDLCFPYKIENYLEKFNEVGLSVRVRNLGRKIPCKVTPLFGSAEQKLELGKNGKDNFPADEKNTPLYKVNLSEPEFGVAPGQSAVFYVGDLMLGGGVIEVDNQI